MPGSRVPRAHAHRCKAPEGCRGVAGRLGGRKLRSDGFEPSPAAGQVLRDEPQPTGEEDVGWGRSSAYRTGSVFQPRSFPPAGHSWLPTRCCRAEMPGVEQRMPRRVGWHWPSPLRTLGRSAASPPPAQMQAPDAPRPLRRDLRGRQKGRAERLWGAGLPACSWHRSWACGAPSRLASRRRYLASTA